MTQKPNDHTLLTTELRQKAAELNAYYGPEQLRTDRYGEELQSVRQQALDKHATYNLVTGELVGMSALIATGGPEINVDTRPEGAWLMGSWGQAVERIELPEETGRAIWETLSKCAPGAIRTTGP